MTKLANYLIHGLIFLTLGFSSLSLASFHYQPTLDFAQYALHSGNSRSANLIEGFLPLYQSAPNFLTFTDIRFYNPNSTPVEGNLDLGFRRVFHQNSRLFGLYAGYDRYRSETRRYYNQANVGIEYWCNKLFLGGNAYLPFGTKVYDNDNVNLAYLVPTDISYRYNIAFGQGKERALPGIDAEIGYDLTQNLTIYGGGYYFDHSNIKRITGPKARATYTLYRAETHRLLGFFDRIRLEGLVSHDSVRGTSWMAGLRFTFGLSRHPNPTKGLRRHMVDPIRRDTNGIIEAFNNPFQFYRIDNRLARVDLVTDNLDRSIDQAVDPTIGTAADIIGVRGDRLATAVLEVGDRELTITGGNYSFTVNGHSYTIDTFGKNGNLTSGSGENLFELNGTNDVSLQNLTLASADDDSFALLNNIGDSFGHITINNITSSAPFDFRLTETNAEGEVTFRNNTLDLSDATAIDANIGDFAGVLFTTNDVTQQLIVRNFSNNTISVSDRTTDTTDIYAVYTFGTNTNPITFTNATTGNVLDVSDNTTAMDFYGLYSNYINFDDTVNGNSITVSGNSNGLGIGWRSENQVNITGGFINNTIDASGHASDGEGWYATGNINVDGNFNANTFTASNNGGSFIYGLDLSSLTVTGNFNYNTLESNDNMTTGSGWYVAGTTTIGGNFAHNTFRANGNEESTIAFLVDSSIIVAGDFNNNTFIAQDTQNAGATAAYFFSSPSLTNVYGNHFIVSSNNGGSTGLYIERGADISNDFRNNTFTVTDNDGGSNGLFWGTEPLLGGDFKNNTFNLTDNSTGNTAAVFASSSPDSEITGSIMNNNITIVDNLSVTNVGFSFQSNSILTLNGLVTGNRIAINNVLTADYGFSMGTVLAGNEIIFEENSETGINTLTALNYNAATNITGAGDVIFNGPSS